MPKSCARFCATANFSNLVHLQTEGTLFGRRRRREARHPAFLSHKLPFRLYLACAPVLLLSTTEPSEFLPAKWHEAAFVEKKWTAPENIKSQNNVNTLAETADKAEENAEKIERAFQQFSRFGPLGTRTRGSNGASGDKAALPLTSPEEKGSSEPAAVIKKVKKVKKDKGTKRMRDEANEGTKAATDDADDDKYADEETQQAAKTSLFEAIRDAATTVDKVQIYFNRLHSERVTKEDLVEILEDVIATCGPGDTIARYEEALKKATAR